MKFVTNFSYRKSLGQNFIYDEGYLQNMIAKLGLSKTDTVVEIGTGAGTLTRVLSRTCGKVLTFEVDRRLQPTLQQKLSDLNNVDLAFADALDIKESELPTQFKLVANIPYYITTPLLLKFLHMKSCIEINILVQDDVARRITAKPNGKDYGALSVTTQAYAECNIIQNVPRTVFTPVPKVDSAFVQLKMKKEPKTDDNVFDKLVKGLFAARRKTVLNALKNTFKFDTETAREILQKSNIDETLRPEQISVEKFVALCDKM